MKSLNYLNKFFFKYRLKILIGILITIIARFFALVAPNLIGESITIIDNYLSNGGDPTIIRKSLIKNISFIVGAAFLAGGFTFIMRQTLINVSRFIEFDLKNEIFQKYQDLDLSFYKKNRVGDLMNRISEDVSKVRMYVGPALMYSINIKSYTIEDELNKHIDDISHETQTRHVDLAKFQAWFLPMMVLLIGLSNILVIYIGGNQFISGKIELGILAEFIIYVNMLTWPVATVGWVTSIVQQAEASQARINQFLKEKINVINKNSELKTIEGVLEFNNVNFTYDESNIKALSNISFRLQMGKSLGVIGPVGCGKSTLLELIVRNYDPQSGKILIDNTDLKSHNKNNVRDYISYVPQTTFLFSDTIKNNIRFGKNDASDSEIKKYAKISCINDEIEEFPKKYNSILGERGINLSGGQKQRIALARALIKKPKILLLDDCLSAVDVKTEKEISNNLQNYSEDITKIIVSQRTSILKNCDRIIVMNNSEIIETGTHNELIKNTRGYYYQINFKQNKKTH